MTDTQPLTLYYHPLSSFCWKALVALYERQVPFTPVLVDFSEPTSRDAFLNVWPMGQFPVIRHGAYVVPESSIIIEYLDQKFPGGPLIPVEPDLARQTRLRDRFFDSHIHIHMQKITGDRIRPADKRDPFGVEEARKRMATALRLIEQEADDRQWAMGETFTLADCSASPALFYADKVNPIASDYPKTLAYLERLKARPSFARVLKEAEPYFAMFPA